MPSKRKLCAPTRVMATAAVSSFRRRKGRRLTSTEVVCNSNRYAEISQLSNGNEATTTSLSDAVDLDLEQNGDSLSVHDDKNGIDCDDESGNALRIVTSPSSQGDPNIDSGEECSNDDVIDMCTRKENDNEVLPVLDLPSSYRYCNDVTRTYAVPCTEGQINLELSQNAGDIMGAIAVCRQDGIQEENKEAETVGGEGREAAVSRLVMEKIESTLDGVSTWRDKYQLVEELIAELEFIKERLILQKTRDSLPSMTSSPIALSSSLSNENYCKSATWTVSR